MQVLVGVVVAVQPPLALVVALAVSLPATAAGLLSQAAAVFLEAAR